MNLNFLISLHVLFLKLRTIIENLFNFSFVQIAALRENVSSKFIMRFCFPFEPPNSFVLCFILGHTGKELNHVVDYDSTIMQNNNYPYDVFSTTSY